jgi:transcriptional regulator with XRE-family HTH domain
MARRTAKKPKVVGESFRDALAERMKSPTFRFHYEQRGNVGELAIAVRAMRERAGLSQRDLARLVGVSQPMIARVEKGLGSRAPGWDLTRKIAIAFGRQMRVTFSDKVKSDGLVEVEGVPADASTEPSRASLREIPEVDFSKGTWRRNRLAARIATKAAGKHRPQQLAR